MSQQFSVAFLGLGAMGSRMAKQLIKAGHELKLWNRSPKAMQPLVDLGAIACDSPAQAAAGADYVISMVRDDVASRVVWLDPATGAVKSMKAGSIAIECSTLTPAWISDLETQMRQKSISFCDAPVAGSRPQAEAAKLIFFVGSDAVDYERVSSLLSLMGSQINHTGAVGSGARIKLVINSLFGVQLAAVAELLGFLQKSGLDLRQAMEIVGETPVCSPAAKLAAAAMIGGNFAPAFPIELVEKDFAYMARAAQGVSANMPLSHTAHEAFKTAINTGYGQDNITGIAQSYL